MKASKNSLHAKMYEFTYTSDLPENLCPYFWKILMATILFIPNFIFQFPALLIMLFKRDSEFLDDCAERRKTGFSLYLASVILLFYLTLTFNGIKMIFQCYSYDQTLGNAGIALNVSFFLIWLFFFIKHHIEKKGKPIKEKKPKIIVEFIKAKIGKYCPKIDWE